MKLLELKIEAEGNHGWFSKQLIFGDRITQLYGPNGCGKTPIIKSIAYALGYPVKFRDDIYNNCAAAVLRLETGLGELELRRKIDSHFDVEVRNGNDSQTFYTEKDYSQYLFNIFDVKISTLTSNRNESTVPYMATFLPVFYLDQDNGYTNIYKAPSSFIKDQYTEMMRLVFGLPPKNSFDQKKLVIGKKKKLEQTDRMIVKKQEFIESLSNEIGTSNRNSEEIGVEITKYKEDLEEFKESKSLKYDAESTFNSLIYEKQVAQKDLINEIVELTAKVNGFEKIKNEIEVEVNTLSLNEEARRLFDSFDDICSNADCGLFLGSSDSYGKNLLYLKDQIKDLERNTTIQKRRIEELEIQSKSMKEEVSNLEGKRNDINPGGDVEGLVETIGELTRKVINLQREKQTVEELEKEKNGTGTSGVSNILR